MCYNNKKQGTQLLKNDLDWQDGVNHFTPMGLSMGDLVPRKHLTLSVDIVMGTSGDMRDDDLCIRGSGVRNTVDSTPRCARQHN